MRVVFSDVKLLLLTLFLNLIFGPMLMYLLAIAFFHNGNHKFMAGLSLVGCARCIAMVLVWNELSGGDSEYCAAIVAINSILSLVLYSPYAVFFVKVLPAAMSLGSTDISVNFTLIVTNVAIYMGIPFVAGVITYYSLTYLKGILTIITCYIIQLIYTLPSCMIHV